MSKPPLWELMRRAYDASPDDWTERHGYAAEIRALRDWLVPEEGPRPDLSHAGTRWDERQRLRALLTAEADRAERGEVKETPAWPGTYTRSMRAAETRRLCITAGLSEESSFVKSITLNAADGMPKSDVVDLIFAESDRVEKGEVEHV